MKDKKGVFNRAAGYLFGRTVEEKKGSMGLLFILPWMIGVLWFFLVPLIQSMVYVFCDVKIQAGGIATTFTGLQNIDFVFVRDPKAIITMAQSIGQTLLETMIILVFSIVVSIILNQKFQGRTISRVVFALPIIVSSGVVLSIFKEDLFTTALTVGSESTVFNGLALQKSLIAFGISSDIVNKLSSIISEILDLMWKSGVQILLFIAGLNAVPRQLYEVCDVEGSTAWQTFWKVTFPLISPFILLNVVYTIIDSFTFYSNPVMKEMNTLFIGSNYSYSTTLGVVYFLAVLIVTGVVGGLISRKVFYIEK